MAEEKTKIKTNILAPSETSSIQFFGHNPMQVFKVIPDLMMDVYRIDPGAFWEDEIRIDTSGDPTPFFGYWRGKEGKDAFTTFWIDVEIRGRQSKETKQGDVTVKIKPKLNTEFKFPTPIHRGILWIYSRAFYKKQMQTYIKEAREMTDDFENAVRTHFDLMSKESV